MIYIVYQTVYNIKDPVNNLKMKKEKKDINSFNSQ